MIYLKKEYQNATVAVKIKNRTVTVDTSLLSEDEKKRLSKNEVFKFLFQDVEPAELIELTELIEPNQEPEIFPEFSRTKLQQMTIGELKTVYHFVTGSSKREIIEEIIELNYGNPESEENEEEQQGVL